MTEFEVEIKVEIVAVVNGWEIGLDTDDRPTNIAPYFIRYGTGYTDVFWFRSLKSAIRWAEKN